MRLPVVFGLGLFVAPTPAQNWTNITGPNTIGAVTASSGLTFNDAQFAEILGGPLIVYGGAKNGPVANSQDTVTFDGVDWALQTVTKPTSLGSLTGHSMAWCPASGRVMLFGGFAVLTPSRKTYEYEHATRTWTEVESGNSPGSTSPAAVGWCATCATPIGALVFGGLSSITALPGSQTWLWNGVAWSKVAPATTPPARSLGYMAYDASRGVAVLFGGSSTSMLNDTWEFNGVDWVQVVTTNAPSPRAAQEGGMCFDLSRGRCVLRGGVGSGGAVANETWEYDGIDWHQVTTAAMPPAGVATNVEYHALTGQCVAAGSQFGTLVDETWTLGGTGAIFETFGTGCVGTIGKPELRSVGGSVPALGTSFQAEVTNVPQGLTLFVASTSFTTPIPLATVGMPPGCQAYVDTLLNTQLVAGNPATWTLAIPVSPLLQGAEFWLQGFPLDATATPLDLIASNGGHGVLY